MHCLLRPFIALLCGLYGFLWFGINYDDVKRLFTERAFHGQKQFDAPGLTDDIFDQCRLQNGPLWTSELKKWLHPEHDPMKSCNRSFSAWSELLPDGRVQLTEACPEEADCRARAVLLKNEYHTTLGKWYEIREEMVFENDIVEVECQIADVVVYSFIHTQIWRGKAKKNLTAPRPKKAEKLAVKPPSVYIIVLDSIGASHGRRVFNQTHRFLKEEFGAVEMLHMNKVGENSRPNGIAFLFGKLISNINRNMYGLPPIPADWNRTVFCKSFLEEKGFILKEFEKKGYVTMMAEDWDKGVFNWPGCYGFQKQPTTHYMRPFQLRFNKDNVGTMKSNMSTSNCFEQHLFLNEYTEKFIKAYPDRPRAFLTWASYLGHDSPNLPFHTDIQYKEFFERNKEEFDNSFIFFMGDHGLRFGWYSRDPVGQRDVNNPMLMISVPRRLRDDVDLMANLEQNSKELLTMFDTHATLVDIAETFSRPGPYNFSETAEKPGRMGSSLLRPLPSAPRNCKTLPIPPQYCLCEIKKERLNITAAHSAIGKTIATVVNERVAEANVSDICAELEMDQLTQLQRVVGAHDLYEATVRLRPGGGVFQTFVRGFSTDYSVVVPDVTRINKYGKQGDCTKMNEIRPLCYCKSDIAKSSSLR
ncbi:hypothetical protein PENTCL1PPCAC_11050, partial [Pristionchus entomophagus]